MRRVLIVTDAWRPQVNGVVRCLESVGRELTAQGAQVDYLAPDAFLTVPMPSYPEIRLSLLVPPMIGAHIERLQPDQIHIATEGPIGLCARQYCIDMGLSFTTSYHTRFPEYLAARMPVPEDWTYAYLRWFHAAASATLVPTASLLDELRARQFTNLRLWTRGVDGLRFAPAPKTQFTELPGPHLLYVGRVAVEKNIEAFLKLDVAGTKIVVGDGPALVPLKAAYPDALFLGHKSGAELSAVYASADVFVFPSRTDTFGNVMIEALSSGLPVAAYPVTGPIDILTDPTCGAVDEDLGSAVRRALTLSRDAARAFAGRFTWSECARIFSDTLVPVRTRQAVAA